MVKVKCENKDCDCTVAEIETNRATGERVLIITGKHHGKKHETRVVLDSAPVRIRQNETLIEVW